MLQLKTALTDLPMGLAWKKYCGFLNLSLEAFLEVQEQQLLGALPALARSGIGRHFLKGRTPRTVREFRRLMPLTTYEDCLPFLSPEAASSLPEPPVFWAQTTRRNSQFTLVPYTRTAFDHLLENAVALFFLASAAAKEAVKLQAGDRVLYNLAPVPYLSGFLADALPARLDLRPVLNQSDSHGLEFEDKVALGFTKALEGGVDVMAAMTSILLKTGEEFQRHADKRTWSRKMLYPRVALRLLRALVVSRLQLRPILPKDLWPLKALICWGMDTSIYRDRLVELWGCEPYEFAATTEAGIMAAQSWTKKGLTLFPTPNFLEFIPERAALKAKDGTHPQPGTLLLSQLEVGRRYEVVITATTGMPFLRYRLGHLMEVLSLGDEAASIRLPQVRFVGRCDHIIDLAGFTRLDELTLHRAVKATEIPLEDWAVRQERQDHNSRLCFYLEPRDGHPPDLAERLHLALKEEDRFYRDLDAMLGLQPLQVTVLAPGTFQRYYEVSRKNGAALAQRQVTRINPSDEEVQTLLQLSRGASS